MSPEDKSRIRPRMFVKKGWGKLFRKTTPPLIDFAGKDHDPENDLVGEVFVYHPVNHTPFNHVYYKHPTNFKVETVKILYIDKDKKVSLHFHISKREIFYLVKGELEVTLISDGQEDTISFKEGDTLCINPGMVHQMKGLEEENILLEVSTLDQASDSYRIKKGD